MQWTRIYVARYTLNYVSFQSEEHKKQTKPKHANIPGTVEKKVEPYTKCRRRKS